jgi:hypothetical protein
MIDRDLLRLNARDTICELFTPDSVFPPVTICDVSPTEIATYVEYDVFTKYGHAGHIEPGEWDLRAASLSSSPKYRLIRDYQTGVIDSSDLTYQRLRTAGYPESEAAFYTEYGYGTYLDALFDSVKRNGIENDHTGAGSQTQPVDRYDQIAVNIGRNGAVIFNSCGFHRLTTAKLLAVETVPVRLNVIHEDWWERGHGIKTQLLEHPSLSYVDRLRPAWIDVVR